jgi:plasmid stability protein
MEARVTDLLIRDVPPELRETLSRRAKRSGHSLSEEAKRLLALALATERPKPPLGQALRETFGKAGFVELELPERKDGPRDPFAE